MGKNKEEFLSKETPRSGDPRFRGRRDDLPSSLFSPAVPSFQGKALPIAVIFGRVIGVRDLDPLGGAMRWI